jgi:uncharacterized lipoprotein YehR (DUF1307 family)
MRKIKIIALIFLLVMVVAGCGPKDETKALYRYGEEIKPLKNGYDHATNYLVESIRNIIPAMKGEGVGLDYDAEITKYKTLKEEFERIKKEVKLIRSVPERIKEYHKLFIEGVGLSVKEAEIVIKYLRAMKEPGINKREEGKKAIDDLSAVVKKSNDLLLERIKVLNWIKNKYK